MDVVELVPSVSFSPRTNLYGRMFGNVIFKGIDVLFQKGNTLASSLINREMTRNRAGLRGLVGSAQIEYILTKI